MTYREQTIEEFLAGIASERVAPAGGTGAAVTGAIGAALCEMVCIHSVEDGDSTGGSTALAEVQEDLRAHRDHLLGLGEADASIVDDLFSGADGPVDQSAVKRSIGVPLTIAEASLTVLELAGEVVENGNRNAVPDAVTGVMLVRGALHASVFTVRRNLRQVSDQSFTTTIEGDVAELERRGQEAYERVMETVDGRVNS